MKFEVEFYETKNGIQPAREFILLQEKRFIAKTLEAKKYQADYMDRKESYNE